MEESLSARVGCAPPQVLPAFGGELLQLLCRGQISEELFLQEVIYNTGWPITVDELKQEIRNNFSRKVEGMEKVLEQHAREYELVLLSDHAREWVKHIHQSHPHLKVFNNRLFSYQLGQTKRESSTFQRLLTFIKKSADECIFIDDKIENVECARSVGIFAIHFKDAPTLIKELQKSAIICR
ncbi:MAG: yihX [Verrucomicrobiales bacterium]|nr:yihX [Verrucomicrobiales bacterium]